MVFSRGLDNILYTMKQDSIDKIGELTSSKEDLLTLMFNWFSGDELEEFAEHVEEEKS